jgi:hypothetical protein
MNRRFFNANVVELPIRLGVALPTSSRIVPISATDVNVLTLDNLVILCFVGFWLSLRLLTDGHLPEPWLLAIIAALAARWVFRRLVVWLTEITPQDSD